jgi:hypothetical protein
MQKQICKIHAPDLVFNLTNFVELSPSWEAASHAATQELLNISWNPEVRYRVHKYPPYPEPDQSSPF